MVAVGLVVRALIIAAVLIAAGSSFDAASKSATTTLIGVVSRVSDGDTLWVRPATSDGSRKPLKVRLLGIDAPESCQVGGTEATAALASRVMNRKVVLRVVGRDSYGRLLGELHSRGEDVGAWLVREGHAWSHRRHGVADVYAAEERDARAARRGLFARHDAIEPGEFRRRYGVCR